MDHLPLYQLDDDDGMSDVNYADYHELLDRLTNDEPVSYDYFEDYDVAEYLEQPPEDLLSQIQFLWTECTIPIATQAFMTAAPLALLTCLLPALNVVGGAAVPSSLSHLTSAGFGLAALLIFFPDAWHILLAMVIASAFLLLSIPSVFRNVRHVSTIVLSACLLSAAVYLEMTMDGPTWHKLRGAALLVAMKALSVAIDGERPRWEALLGYLLCPGKTIF